MFMASMPISGRTTTIPGAGRIIAPTLATEIDPMAFESGRHLAAWIGLAPKEHSTGGKQRMGGIAPRSGPMQRQAVSALSRAGNERLRCLLVTGATAVIRFAIRPGNKHASAWLLKLLQHKPRKLVAVALANKMARIAWATLAKVPTDRLPSVGMPGEGMMESGDAYRRLPAVAATAEALQAIVELDLSKLQTIEPPRGFGGD
jgi:hypothetical protein